MKKKLLDLSGKIDKLEIECFKSISNCADCFSIDFFLVGAMARDIVFEVYNIETGRATKDLDIAVQVENWDHYSRVKKCLLQTNDFAETDLQQRLELKGILEVDIVPFGLIAEPDESISWPDDQSTKMSTMGFKDAFDDAFSGKLSDDPDFNINIASICGLTIMKIISWKDKYPNRSKDAVDLEFMMRNYIDAGNFERFHDEASELIDENVYDYEITSAQFLGKETAIVSSIRTQATIQSILEEQTGDQDRYHLVEHMMGNQTTGRKEFEDVLELLESFKKGFFS